MSNYVWYASYGSNLLRERFMKYILGGTMDGATFNQIGCTDNSLPIRDEQIIIHHQLYFALEFAGWEGKGVCFIKQNNDPGTETLGRMYLVTEQQFKEIVMQENGFNSFEDPFTIDLAKTVQEGHSLLPAKYYGRLIYLGDHNSNPVFTFTADWDEKEVQYNRPGQNYLSVITRGIKETYDLSNEEIVKYFSEIPGIKGNMDNEELFHVVMKA